MGRTESTIMWIIITIMVIEMIHMKIDIAYVEKVMMIISNMLSGSGTSGRML